MRRLLLAMCIITGAAAYAAAPADWIVRDKIRAGWIYSSDGADKLALFRQQGMNCLITHAGEEATFTKWAREAKRAGVHLIGVVGASFDGQKAGMRRCVFGNGYESVLPCPLDQRYWDEVLTGLAVRLAEEGKQGDRDISGALIDWEMYANSDKGGQIYYTDACYCDHCFGGFLRSVAAQAGETPALRDEARGASVSLAIPFGDRKRWLTDRKLYEGYHPYLQRLVRAQAEQMRERVLAINPSFFLGFYPIPHNWHLRGVAQGLGKPSHPMIAWATTTYGGGGPKAVADDWRAQFAKDEIHAYYCGGMLLRFYSSENLAKNIFEIARKSDGYWLFTVHTLCIPEDQQNTDYYLASGTPADYLREIARANRELDQLARDPGYGCELEFLDEPVRYRHAGYDVNRFQPPALRELTPAAPHGDTVALPPLNLTWSNFLMMLLQPGEEPAVTFDVNKNASGDVWGVSYAVLDPAKQTIATGCMPPGAPYTVRFKAAAAGLHTVVVTAGYYGRATLKSTTVPFALWTGHRYQLAGPGATLYFHVPDGLAQFAIKAQCEWGTTQAKLTVLDPEGAVVLSELTDTYVRSAKLAVPTKAKSGVWALRIEAVPDQSFRSLALDFDKALAPAVSLKPEWTFSRQ